MSEQVLNEKARTVHLFDWSGKEERNRHLIWCVAYRILAKGETKRTAIQAVSETHGIPLKVLQNCCQRSIRITYNDPEIQDHE